MPIIKILPRHFSTRWWQDTYPVFRNSPHLAGDMTNADITSPNYLTQGKGTAKLTNGDQTGAITTLLKGMTRTAVTDNVAYGVGGAKLQQFSATAVTNAGIFPHTITGTGAITGEDVAYYKGNLYYSYNDAGAAGNFGKYDLSTTFGDDYGSTVPTSAEALQNAPHQMVVANQSIYITNGRFIAELDGTEATYVLTAEALDFIDTNKTVASISWNGQLYIAVNSPNITGANANQSAIYTWDGFSDDWNGDPYEVNGRISALFTKNGITFVWFESRLGTSSINTFGYLGNGRVVPLITFDGDLPEYYQVGERGDYIIWLSGNILYLYGSLSEMSVGLSQLLTTPYATSSGLAAPFGEIICSSMTGANYSLAKENVYTVSSSWKSMMFPVSSGEKLAQLDSVVVFTEQMGANAKCDFSIVYDGGVSTKTLDQIITGKTRHIIGKRNLPRVENFRIEVDFSNGSTAHNTSIKEIQIGYHLIDNK